MDTVRERVSFSDTQHFTGHTTVTVKPVCVSVLQAAGPAEGVVGIAGGAARSGLGAEGGAERLPAGTDATGRGTQHSERDQPEPGPQQRPPHQPVPGINRHTHKNTHTTMFLHTCRYTQLFCIPAAIPPLTCKKGDLVLHSGDTRIHYALEIKTQIYLKHYWEIKQNVLGSHCRFLRVLHSRGQGGTATVSYHHF